MIILMIILYLLLLFIAVFLYLRQCKQIRLLEMKIEYYRQQQEHVQQEELQKEKNNLRQDTPPASTVIITTLNEQLLQKVVQQIEQNIDQADYSVEQLSNVLGMHRASLYKKITQLTGKTPQLLIRTIRLKRAQQMFDQGETHIAHVAYAVGFNSTKAFSKRFKEEYGKTPTDYISHRR